MLVAVVSSAALVLTRMAPGDFASELFGSGATRETMARERSRYGLDRPLAVQYLDWVSRALRLDFGPSLLYRRPVTEMLRERAANTAILALVALVVATVLGIPAGIVSGNRPRAWPAHVIRLVSILLLSMPPLLTSILLVLMAARTGWFPLGGMQSADMETAGVAARVVDMAWHLVLPVLALALPLAASLERIQARSMSEAVAQPFTVAAMARGIPWRRIVWRGALRPALVPVASIYGFIIGGLLSGSFVVEVVTRWPGLGRLMWEALRARDLYLVAGCAAAGAAFLGVGTLVSDLAVAWLDPRIRGEEG